MCRHIAYLGPAVPLARLILQPQYGLVRQSFRPRRQKHGKINADGFGIGWYAERHDPPLRYRRDIPAWADVNLPDLAHTIHSTAVLAAVRDGSPGFPVNEAACAPFADDRMLFSYNGRVMDWPESLKRMAVSLPSEWATRDGVVMDSTLLWALVKSRLAAGSDPGPALAAVAAQALSDAPGSRLNLLLTDGKQIAATALGDTLSYLQRDGAVVVASEPYDDDPDWTDVPERSLLIADTGGVEVTALPLPEPEDGP